MSGEAKFDVHKTKEIKKIVKQGVVAESHLLSLAYWIKENYGSTMNDAIKAVLPVRREIRKKITRMVYPCVVRSELEQILQEYARKHYKAKVRVLQAILDQEDYEEGISYEVLQRDHKATLCGTSKFAGAGGRQDIGKPSVPESGASVGEYQTGRRY